MTVETGAILKVVLDYVYPGAGTALNIFYYSLFDAPLDDVDVLDALENWARDDWGNNWEDLGSDAANLNNMTVQEITAAGEVVRDVGARTINLDGSVQADVMPAAVSAYILGYTKFPQVRGSKYVPGIAETVVNDGSFNAGAVAALALLLLEYLGNIIVLPGQQLVPGVISSRESSFVAFTDSGLFNTLPAYQRRRKDGVGI